MKFAFDLTEIRTQHDITVDAENEEEAYDIVLKIYQQNAARYDETLVQITPADVKTTEEK